MVVDYNGSSYNTNLKTNRYCRDTSGYYHIVVASDTTQATEADRVKIYVNGVQITSFATQKVFVPFHISPKDLFSSKVLYL